MSDYWDKFNDAPLFAAKKPDRPLNAAKFIGELEKAGVIEPGRTPPEKESQKSAADLEDCVSKRLADGVAKSIK